MCGLCCGKDLIFIFFMAVAMQFTGIHSAENDVSLIVRGDNVAFEGETVIIECSHSRDFEDTLIVLFTESNSDIMKVAFMNATHKLASATLTDVSNSPTVYCNVSGSLNASAKITIHTIPSGMSPYCVSNYTNGIIDGNHLLLCCYDDTSSLSSSVFWKASNGATFMPDQRIINHMKTRKSLSSVTLSNADNGTIYECVTTFQGVEVGSCTIGPIFVYSKFLLFIETDTLEAKNLSHGDSRKFRCLSFPSADITWMVIEPESDVGLVLSYDGPVLNVTVPTSVTYEGILTLLCLGTLMNNGRTAEFLNLYISAFTNDQSSTAGAGEATLNATETTTPASKEEEILIIIIICGAIGGLVIILAITVLGVCWCKRKQKGYRGNTTQPVEPQRQENGEPEYATPPIGMTTLDNMVHTGEYPAETSDDNGEPDHYETEGGLYTAVNKETKEQSNGDGAAFVPPSSKAYSKSYTDIGRNGNGEFNLASVTDPSVSMGDGSNTEPPQYAMVDKNRHVVIDEGFLDDDNAIIEGDYSEYQ